MYCLKTLVRFDFCLFLVFRVSHFWRIDVDRANVIKGAKEYIQIDSNQKQSLIQVLQMFIKRKEALLILFK